MDTSLFLFRNKIKKKPHIENMIKKQEQIILDENGIIPLIQGGLGNQIFIIAAAYTVHRYLRCQLYILNNPPTKHNFLKNYYNRLWQNRLLRVYN